jgi:hypothetical protein
MDYQTEKFLTDMGEAMNDDGRRVNVMIARHMGVESDGCFVVDLDHQLSFHMTITRLPWKPLEDGGPTMFVPPAQPQPIQPQPAQDDPEPLLIPGTEEKDVEQMCPLMNTREVAEALNIPKSTVVSWRKSGKLDLPYKKDGGMIFYKRSDVLAFATKRARDVKP